MHRRSPNMPAGSDRGAQGDLDSEPALAAALAATRQLIARDRGPLGALRARPTWQRTAVVACVLAVALGVKSRGEPRAELWLHALLAVAGICLLFWPMGKPVPLRLRGACAVAALALPSGFAFWVHADAAGAALGRSPWPCLAYGLLLALPFWLLLKLFDRGAAIGIGRALLAGAIAGLAGNALLHLHCADSGLGHVLLGHALLAAPCAGLALLLGRRGRVRWSA